MSDTKQDLELTEAAGLVVDWMGAGPLLVDAYDSPSNRTTLLRALHLLWGRPKVLGRRCGRCGLSPRRCLCPPRRSGRTTVYREWEGDLVAVNPPRGVDVEVATVVPGRAYVRRIVVPAILCRHFRITSLEVGGCDLLRRPFSAEIFSSEIEPPPFMYRTRRRCRVTVGLVKVTDAPVSFGCKVVGVVPVSARKGEV